MGERQRVLLPLKHMTSLVESGGKLTKATVLSLIEDLGNCQQHSVEMKRERDEARQRAERLEDEVRKLLVLAPADDEPDELWIAFWHHQGSEGWSTPENYPVIGAVLAPVSSIVQRRAALAADPQPAEAGGEEGDPVVRTQPLSRRTVQVQVTYVQGRPKIHYDPLPEDEQPPN